MGGFDDDFDSNDAYDLDHDGKISPSERDYYDSLYYYNDEKPDNEDSDLNTGHVPSQRKTSSYVYKPAKKLNKPARSTSQDSSRAAFILFSIALVIIVGLWNPLVACVLIFILTILKEAFK